MRIYDDVRAVQTRIGVLQYLLLAAIGALLAYYWHLQVLRGRYYRQLAESNRTRLVSIQAPRGRLFDRNGRSLVENRPSFNVVVTPEHLEDLDATIARLGSLLQVGEAQIRERLVRRTTPFRPVVVKPDAELADVATIEARRLELAEASVEVVPLRSYPLATAIAHALGRVGEVTERQLQLPEFGGIEPGDLVGQAGVEWQYNRRLMGRDGHRRVIVNSRGAEVSEAERREPEAGPSLTLTLDLELQRAIEQAYAGRAGAAVALDPISGEILAMASLPAYDPNQFSTGVDAAAWGRLSTDSDNPLMNRAIQGLYAPGSVFKIVMAAAALEEGVVTPSKTIYCPGYLSIYNTVFRCNKASGHGMVNLHRALAQSCNVYFYQVGVRLEIDRIARYAKRMGLGVATGVDLPHEAVGLVPSSEWKRRVQKLSWFPGETVSVAIGQGQLLTTPIQLARLIALVANGGRLTQPFLVKTISEVPQAAPPSIETGLSPATLEIVREGLCAAVGAGGTGWRARIPGLDLCGKTGSAQVVGHAHASRAAADDDTLAHGWFVGFAPARDPKIALAVLIEHGESGGAAAAPVARQILERFFASQRPPPAAATTP